MPRHALKASKATIVSFIAFMLIISPSTMGRRLVQEIVPADDCRGTCFDVSGFQACRTATGAIRGCTGTPMNISGNNTSDNITSAPVGITPDPTCSTQCQATPTGMFLCLTVDEQVKGCLGGDSSAQQQQTPSTGYTPDPSCVTECSQTESGFVYCWTTDEEVKGCLGGDSSAQQQQAASISGYIPYSSCSTECIVTGDSGGFVYCLTDNNEVKGCIGGNSRAQVAATPAQRVGNDSTAAVRRPAGYVPDPSCNTECESIGGLWSCLTPEGKRKGCLASSNVPVLERPVGYAPDPTCSTPCIEDSKGYWSCNTIHGQIKGCTSSSTPGGEEASAPWTPGVSIGLIPAPDCSTRCQTTEDGGFVFCTSSKGEVRGCTLTQPIHPSKTGEGSVDDGDERPGSSVNMTPAEECVTECQPLQSAADGRSSAAAFYVCTTATGAVKGCLGQISQQISGSSSTTSSSDDSGGGSSTGAIIGAVVGAIVGVAVVLALVVAGVLYYKHKRENTQFVKFNEPDPFTVAALSEGNVDSASGGFTEFQKKGKDFEMSPTSRSVGSSGSA